MAFEHAQPDDEVWRDAVRTAWLSRRLGFTNETYDRTINIDDIINDTKKDNDKEHFRRCWGRNSCQTCLGISACSWCPFSATCVPNDYLVPALAPAWEGDHMCPHWAERWELRTRPLGCQVSTITSLTALVAVAVTLAVVLLVWAVVVLVRRFRQRQRQLSQWWSIRTWFWRAPQETQQQPQQPPSEQSPLLSDIQ